MDLFFVLFVIVPTGVIICGIGCGISYENGKSYGKTEVHQEAVDREYGSWEVFEREFKFRWKPRV